MPRFDRSFTRRALLTGGAALLATLSCGREVTGPEAGRVMRVFAFAVQHEPIGLANGVASDLVPYERVRVLLLNGRGGVALDRVVPFPSTSDSVVLDLDIPLSPNAPPSGEVMELSLAFVNAQGDTVFRGGPLPVTVVAVAPGEQPPPPPVVPVRCVGVGANAATVQVTPRSDSALAGDGFTFTAVARDGQGQPVANTPIAWRSTDSTIARINPPGGAGAGVARAARGPVSIIAQLITAPFSADTVTLHVLPRAQTLQLASGNNQSAIAGDALADPIVARVLASDGLPLEGVAVTFAVATGGGDLSTTTEFTDLNGLAAVTWQLGPTAGAQTVTASVAGLAGSPVTFTATATIPAATLIHHYPMNGDVSDAVGGVDGQLFGGAAVVDGALSLDGETGFAELPQRIVPTSGSYSVSLFVRNRTAIDFWAEYLSQGALGNAFFIGHAPEGQIRVGDAWLLTGFATPPIDGLYHHFVVTVDAVANQTRLYVDGVQRASTNIAVTSSPSGGNTRFGRQHTTNLEYLDGEIDEVRVYTGALTAAEVAGLWTTGPSTVPRLVFASQPTAATVGQPIAPPVVVRVEDAVGRLLTNFTGNVDIGLANNPTGATLGGTTTVAAVGGIATFADLTVNLPGVAYQLRAGIEGAVSGPSAPFDVAGGGSAGQNTWVNALGGPWSVAANWSLGRAPVPGDTVLLTTPGGFQVTLDVDATVARIIVGAPGATATLDVPGPRVLFVTEALQVEPTGRLLTSTDAVVGGPGTLENGGLVSMLGGGIAMPIMNAGTILVRRDASAIAGALTTTATSVIRVQANEGAGSFTFPVANGFINHGLIELTATDGAYEAGLAIGGGTLVNDVGGTLLLAVGSGGGRSFFGALVNLGQVTVAAPGVMTLLDEANSNSGTISVGATLSVGIAGAAPLLVNSGTVTIAGGQVLGLTAGSWVQASGGTLNGGGTVAVTPGATLRLLGASILSNVANSGLVEASGLSGVTGGFSMNSGAVLRVGGIGPETGASTLTLANGFTNSGTIELGNQADAPRALGASLAIGAGTLTNAAAGTIRSLPGNGGGARTIVGPVLNQGLIDVAPGTAGELVVNGALNTSGSVALEIGGLAAGTEHDRLTVTGLATLAGVLDVGLIGGYVPTAGTTFDVLTFGTRSGTFATVNAAPPLQGTPTYGATAVTVNGPLAGATVNAWTNPAGGSWSTAANWSLGRVPIAGDSVVIALAGTYTVSLDVNASIGALDVGGGPGVQTVEVADHILSVAGRVRVETTGELVVVNGLVGGTGSLDQRGLMRVIDGSVSLPVQQRGTLNASGLAQFTGGLATFPGSTTRVSGGPVASATLGVAGDLVNTGTLELTSTDGAFNATVEAPTLRNEEGGTVTIAPGGGGVRAIAGALVNLGTMNVGADLLVGGLDAVHVTSGPLTIAAGTMTVTQTSPTSDFGLFGTVAIGAGAALVVNGRTATLGTSPSGTGALTFDGVTLQVPGAWTNAGLTVLLRNTTVAGAGTLTNLATGTLVLRAATFGAQALQNQGLLETAAVSFVNAPLTNAVGGILRIAGEDATGDAELILDNGMTNAGTLQLTSGGSGPHGALLALGSGALDNAVGGIVEPFPGSGGSRTIDGAVVNAGLIRLLPGTPMVLRITGTLNTSGTIALDLGGALAQTEHDQLVVTGATTLGGTLDLGLFGGFVPAAASSFPVLLHGARTGAFSTITAAAPLQSAVTYGAGAVSALGPVAALGNVWTNPAGGAWSAGSNWSLGRAPITSDTVSIALDGTYTVTLDVSASVARVVLGGGTGLKTLQHGASTLTVSDSLFVLPGGALPVTGSGALAGPGVLVNTGSMLLTGAALGLPLHNAGSLETRGTASLPNAFTNAAGGTLTVRGAASGGTAALTVANGFTNGGLISLTSQDGGYASSLTVTNGVLVNEGTLTTVPGSGGARTLAFALDNRNLVTVGVVTTLGRAGAAHVNSGVIDLTAANLTLTQSGTTPSFTNDGGVVQLGSGRTWTVNGGLLDLVNGLVSGGNGWLVTGASTTIDFTPDVVQPRLTLSATTTVPADFVVPTGDSLRLDGGTFANTTLLVQGVLLLEGATTLTTALTTVPTATIRVRGSAAGGGATPTITNGFTNSGRIELTSIDGGYATSLTVPGGPLVNAAGATLATLAGAGGSRTLTLELENAGTVDLAVATTLNGASAQHVNSGTINVAGGNLSVTQSGTGPSFTNVAGGVVALSASRTWTVGGGVLDIADGLVSGGSGFLVTTGTTIVAFTTATVQPRLTFSATTEVPLDFTIPAGDSLRLLDGSWTGTSLTVAGLLLLEGATTLNTALVTSAVSTVRVRGSSVGGGATPTFTSGLVNAGLLELTSIDGGYLSRLTVTGGALQNATGATLAVLAGAGGSRTLTATLDNQGTLTLAVPTTLNGPDADHVNGGTISVGGGNLTLSQSGTSPSFTNAAGGVVALGASRTWTIANGALDLTQGAVTGGNGFLVTTGTTTVDFAPPDVQPRLTFGPSTVLPAAFTIAAGDSLRLLDGTFNNTTLQNDGLLILEGATSLTTAFTTGPGSTVRVRGSAAGGGATPTFVNGFTNTQLIELTSIDGGYVSQLTVGGTLVNETGGMLSVLTGAGGSRTLTAVLDNRGMVQLGTSLAMNAASAQHLNTGTIDVAGGNLTLTQSGTTPSFLNGAGGVVALAPTRTWTVSGGILDLLAGSVTGGSGRLITTGAPFVNFTPSDVEPRLTFSATTTVPSTFTIPTGDSLRLLDGTIAPANLLNAGLLLLEGATTVTTALTMDALGEIRVRGSAAGGAATPTITNGFTNAGTVRLTSIDGGYVAQLTVANGALQNAAGASLLVEPGAGGSRTLAAVLENAGAVTTGTAFTLARPGAAHVNTGTITVGGGTFTLSQSGTAPSFTNAGTVALGANRTWTVSGGELELRGGLVSGGDAFITTTGTPTVRFTTASIQPRLTLSAGTVVPDAFTIPAGDSLRLLDGRFAPPSLTNLGLLLMEGAATIGAPSFTQSGTLRVRGSAAGGAATATFEQPLSNAGLVELTTINGGYAVTLSADALANQATGTVAILTGSGGTRTLAVALDNAGAINVATDVTLARAGAVHVNGGTITATSGDIQVTQAGAPASFTTLASSVIALGTRSLTVSGGDVDVRAGLISGNGRFITTGAPTVRFAPATLQPRVTFSATTVLPEPLLIGASDSVRVLDGVLAPASLTNSGRLLLEGDASVPTPVTNATGGLLWVRGNAAGGTATATLGGGLVNEGTVRLEAQDGGYATSLSAGTATLTNAAGGVLEVNSGSGGTRALTAGLLDNLGTMSVNATAMVNGPVNQRGQLNVAVARTLTITGVLQLFTGSNTVALGTLSSSGGCVNLGGVLSGFLCP